ncbi:hypothetical protein [Amantichitinum ursilacus]|uniref:Uncharacterized protein n=1 Tax=Amantichitinum ursilacus TaxID=857265 RepID=A0A0N0GKZ3_9NEIS|nr:hypothetical protein [Amantichitinum ursilacus]KPC49564.1 hypothetical protein WG78_19610 [Amantichitinum ursilacus]
MFAAFVLFAAVTAADASAPPAVTPAKAPAGTMSAPAGTISPPACTATTPAPRLYTPVTNKRRHIANEDSACAVLVHPTASASASQPPGH